MDLIQGYQLIHSHMLTVNFIYTLDLSLIFNLAHYVAFSLKEHVESLIFTQTTLLSLLPQPPTVTNTVASTNTDTDTDTNTDTVTDTDTDTSTDTNTDTVTNTNTNTVANTVTDTNTVLSPTAGP